MYQYRQKPGFMMAMIIIMMIAAGLILSAAFVLIGSTNSQSQSIIFRQVAYEAARSSLDMAKYYIDGDLTFEQLKPVGCDNTIVLCTNDTNPRNGMPDALQERTLSSSINTRYRTTTQITNVAPGSDARSKKITAIGRVYLPATSTTPRFTRVLTGEVVTSTITAVSPSAFSPMAWYDATCNPSDPSTDPFRDAECTFDTVLTSGSPTSPGDLTSYKEERNPTGTTCNVPTVPSSSTLINFAKSDGKAACAANQQIYTGISFSFPTSGGRDLLKGRTVTGARLKILNKSNSIGGSSNIVIRGLHQPSAGFTDFTTATNSELTGATTASSMTVAFPASNSDLLISGPQLVTIVQELINDARYSDGERLFLRFEATNGAQARRQSDAVNGASGIGIILELEFSGTTSAVLTDGDQPISTWRDRSGNGFNLEAPVTQKPSYSWIRINAPAIGRPGQPQYQTTSPQHPETEIRHLPAVHLENGIAGRIAAMQAEVRASTQRRSNTYTVLGVLRVYDETDKSFNYTGPANNASGMLVSFFGGGWDSPLGTAGRTYAPFWRHPNPKADGTLYHPPADIDARQLCNAQATVRSDVAPGAIIANERGCYTIHEDPTTNVDSAWIIASTRSQSYSRANYFRVNGNNTVPQVYAYETPQLNAPYYISLAFDHLDASTLGGSFSVGELIIYDRELSCPQIETIETYLAEKWKLKRTPDAVALGYVYESLGCFENNIPTF